MVNDSFQSHYSTLIIQTYTTFFVSILDIFEELAGNVFEFYVYITKSHSS